MFRPENRIRTIFRISGILALGMIFWAALGFLLDSPSLAYTRWLCPGSILLYLLAGFLKYREEKRRFREFLEAARSDPEVQDRMRKEKITPGGGSGAEGTGYAFKRRKSGIDWMPANIHGSVPARKTRRSFLKGKR